MKSKTTPAIRRAASNLRQSLEQLRGCDLTDVQECVRHNRLDGDQQRALITLLHSLHQLVEAEALRDSQQDMFAEMDDSEFAAWQHPFNQRALF